MLCLHESRHHEVDEVRYQQVDEHWVTAVSREGCEDERREERGEGEDREEEVETRNGRRRKSSRLELVEASEEATHG